MSGAVRNVAWLMLEARGACRDVPVKPSSVVEPGDVLLILPPVIKDTRASLPTLDFTILHEDEHIVVVDKPAGSRGPSGVGQGIRDADGRTGGRASGDGRHRGTRSVGHCASIGPRHIRCARGGEDLRGTCAAVRRFSRPLDIPQVRGTRKRRPVV